MSQTHNHFTDEQVKVLLQGFCRGQLSRGDIQQLLGVGKSRFFVLLRAYRQNPDSFTIAYQRSSPARLSDEVEKEIKQALLQEKKVVDDPRLPISGYNYTAMRDRLRKKGIAVSVTTIIERASHLSRDCFWRP